MKLNKRAVSPVIAVVLLIALTVAAAAIIWAISSDLLGTGTVSFVASTTTADAATVAGGDATWTGKITVSSAVSLTKVEVVISGLTTVESDETTAAAVALTSGDNIETFTFASELAETLTGSGIIYFYYTPEGGDSESVYELSVTFT
ncbi:MAG: hypothetical protein INQ03_09765 [Candidatus Heimdallarchaeota archaeon]|nr:hypothetical protein [Candidatus Heimdallarchaeota archaeon]